MPQTRPLHCYIIKYYCQRKTFLIFLFILLRLPSLPEIRSRVGKSNFFFIKHMNKGHLHGKKVVSKQYLFLRGECSPWQK